MPRYIFANGKVWVDTSAFNPSHASHRNTSGQRLLITVNWKQPVSVPNVSALETKELSAFQPTDLADQRSAFRQP